jgi:hypothetical protein
MQGRVTIETKKHILYKYGLRTRVHFKGITPINPT